MGIFTGLSRCTIVYERWLTLPALSLLSEYLTKRRPLLYRAVVLASALVVHPWEDFQRPDYEGGCLKS